MGRGATARLPALSGVQHLRGRPLCEIMAAALPQYARLP